MQNIPIAVQKFRAKYGFWPRRELARVYWHIGIKLACKGDHFQSMIAYSHAMRLWPEIVNAR